MKRILYLLPFILIWAIAYAADRQVIGDFLHLKPATLPATGSTGDVRFDSDAVVPKFWNGSDWAEMGGGTGSGLENYISKDNSGFENDIGDWTEFDDSTGFVDGTGGTPSSFNAASAISVNAPKGNQVMTISKSTSSCVGEGVSVLTETIEDKDFGKTLQGSLEVSTVNSSNAPSTGDFEIHAYDVTNSAILPVINEDIVAATGRHDFQVILGSDTASVRLAILCTDSGSTAKDMNIDEVKLGPQLTTPGAIVTAPQDFTPTTQGFGTITVTDAKWWRVGHMMHVQARITLGTVTSDEAQFGLPNSETVQEGLTQTLVGIANNNTDADDFRVLAAGGNSYVKFGIGTSWLSSVTGSSFTSSNPLSVSFAVPIEGWKASAAMSASDLMFKTVKMRAYRSSSNQTISTTSATKTEFNATSYDDFGIFNTSTNTATIPRDGECSLYAQTYLNAMTSGDVYQININVNGTAKATNFKNISSTGSVVEVKSTLRLSAGDEITVTTNTVTDSSYEVVAAEAVSYFEIVCHPDFNIFSLYGESKYLAATSSTLTPSTSAVWQAMTGNKITLTPGVWQISGQIALKKGTGSPAYTSIEGSWATENGDGTSSAPTVVTVDAGNPNDNASAISGDYFQMDMSTIRMTITAETDVYLVPLPVFSSATDARITTYIYAERLQ